MNDIFIKIESYELLTYIKDNNITLTVDKSYWDLIKNNFTSRKLWYEYLLFKGYSRIDGYPIFTYVSNNTRTSLKDIIELSFKKINVKINDVSLIKTMEDNIPGYYTKRNIKLERKNKLNKIFKNSYDYATIEYTTINNEFDFNLFPVAIKVAAKTIGFDLVAVQPMSAPIGHIISFDYVYKENIKKKRREKYKKIFKDNELED